MVVLSVAYTGIIFNLLGQYLQRGERIVAMQIGGSVLIGFSLVMMPIKDTTLELILGISCGIIGTFLLIYPLLRYRLVKFSRVTVLQCVLIIFSSLFGHLLGLHGGAVLRSLSLLSILLLVQALKSIHLSDVALKTILNASLWVLILYAWLWYPAIRYFGKCGYYLVYLIYFGAILMWFFSAMAVHSHLKRWL